MDTSRSVRTSLSFFAFTSLFAIATAGCAVQSAAAEDEVADKTSSAALPPGVPVPLASCIDVDPNASFDLQKESTSFTTPIAPWSAATGACGRIVVEAKDLASGHGVTVTIEDNGHVTSDDLTYTVYGYRTTWGQHCEGRHCWFGAATAWETIESGTASGDIVNSHSNVPHPHFVGASATVQVPKDGGFTALRVAVRTQAGSADRSSKVTFVTE